MSLPFTIYNCGTGYNRSANDVVAQLKRKTVSPSMIHDGPGSGGFVPKKGHNPGGKTTLGGLIGGSGVDANVASGLDGVKAYLRIGGTGPINMCGWSRGAVTCFKIAQALYGDSDTRHLKVNIFAIDPVPGGSGVNNDMWKKVAVSANIGMCGVVLAQHDRRSLFAPLYPTVSGPYTDVDIMPGDHSTIVEYKEGRADAHRLVMHMAKQFLIARGTRFSDPAVLTPQDILSAYARIAESFEDYAAFAKGAGMFSQSNPFKNQRPIRNDQRQVIGHMLPVKPAFFLNEHHRETTRVLFPRVVDEIDRPMRDAFTQQRRSAWLPEFNKMGDESPDHGKLVLFYMLQCEETRKNLSKVS